MKLFILLLCAVALNEASHWAKVKREVEELRNTVDCDENNIQTFDEEFGIGRKDRLQKIADHFRKQQINQTEEDREAIKLFYQNFVPANISTSVPAHDPYKINEEAGITEYLFQGDIHLTDQQLDSIESQLADVDEEGRSKRQVSAVLKKWTDNRVYYYFRSTATARVKEVVKYGLSYLQKKTCLTFQESSTAANRIGVFPGSGCYSGLGMVGGDQELSLGNGCTIVGTVVHEFMHALGVWHMHMRSDRDNYVTINLAVVSQGSQHNFNKLKPNEEINFTPYEYGSSMHYTATSFTYKEGFSVLPKDPAYLYTMGGTLTTFYDIDRVNEHYGCNAKCPRSSICKNGGKPNPANCNICNCPEGYGGNYCDQRPSGCGAVLSATSAWKTETIKLGFSDTKSFRDVPDMCNYWITAPSGYKIELKGQLSNTQCTYGCKMKGIEIKTHNQIATNYRMCCMEYFNKPHVSKLNPTPVILYNHYAYSTYTITYRTVPASADEHVQETTLD